MPTKLDLMSSEILLLLFDQIQPNSTKNLPTRRYRLFGIVKKNNFLQQHGVDPLFKRVEEVFVVSLFGIID